MRARVAVMAQGPWLLLILSLCWPNLSQPAYPTNQPHQVKVGQTFSNVDTVAILGDMTKPPMQVFMSFAT